MVLSVPGVLVSRDGSVREYIGHSNRGGTVFGHVERDGRRWVAACVTTDCSFRVWDARQGPVVTALRDHGRFCNA